MTLPLDILSASSNIILCKGGGKFPFKNRCDVMLMLFISYVYRGYYFSYSWYRGSIISQQLNHRTHTRNLVLDINVAINKAQIIYLKYLRSSQIDDCNRKRKNCQFSPKPRKFLNQSRIHLLKRLILYFIADIRVINFQINLKLYLICVSDVTGWESMHVG